MSITMNVAEAKAKLSALIEAAERGEEVTIARAGTPVVKLLAVTPKPARRLGGLRAYGWTHDTPYEVFAPDPADALDQPLFPDESDPQA
jgi:prevent-host-death family protein